MNSAIGDSLLLDGTDIWADAFFLSALLLFQVQPLLAKILLSWFGAGVGVWTTSLVFFQVTYLLGNAYAHSLVRLRNPRWSRRVHVALLGLSLLLLPIMPSTAWRTVDTANPALRIFGLLTVTIGLPFVLLSATSPLLQAWYAQYARLPFEVSMACAGPCLYDAATLLTMPIDPAKIVKGE